MTLQDWITALERMGKRPETKGRRTMALCPAHADTDRSLSVSEGDGGKVLWHCFAGCEPDAVSDALGISKPSGPPPPIPRRPDPKPEPEPAEPRPLPSGQPFWLPHIYTDIEGNRVLAVVRKDLGPDGKGGMRKTFFQFTPAGDDLWVPGGLKRNRPLFQLPRLSEPGRVLVVEGEKCVMACETAWPTQIVTTWAGGSKAWQKTDWEPLRGRAISLMADADESSRTAMRQLAYYMDSELDCAVHVALPDGENGEDVADWLEDGVEPAAERVESLLQPYEPEEEDRTEPPADPPPPIEGDIGQNDHYQVLGLDGDAVAIWWAAGGRVLSKSGESLCQPATLISFASQALWCRLADADSLGSATARRIGDSLIRVAEDIGQADLSGRTGTGAVMLKAGAAFHLGDRKLFDGKEHVLNDRLDGRIWLAEPRVELGPEASDEEMRAIAESVMAYRWDTPADGKRFLGWLVAGLVGGALEWRVHLYLAGEASTGKSWLLKHVLDLIMGPLYYKIADATPAALARLAENGSVPMVIDEAEPTNEWVVELMKLLRVSAGAEGLRVRADGASGGVVTQLPRFAALLSSTAMPDMHRADATRMSVVKLGEEVDDWSTTQRNIKTALLKADGARSRIIRRMPEIVAEAARVAESLEGHGNDSRAAMMSGALTAGWRAWGLDTSEVNSQRSDPRDELPDAIRMLVDMLSLPFRLDSGREITVLEALQSAVDPWHVADTFGLKRSTGVDKREDGGLAIWPGHSKLRSDLGRRSDRWARTDYEQLLLQAKGATQSGSKTVRFGPHRKRAVLIPQQTLLEFGIPVVRDDLDEDDATVADEQGALV